MHNEKRLKLLKGYLALANIEYQEIKLFHTSKDKERTSFDMISKDAIIGEYSVRLIVGDDYILNWNDNNAILYSGKVYL